MDLRKESAPHCNELDIFKKKKTYTETRIYNVKFNFGKSQYKLNREH